MRTKKYILPAVTLLGLLIALLTLFALPSNIAHGSADITIESRIMTSASTTLAVRAENITADTPFSGITFELDYDPAVVQPTACTIASNLVGACNLVFDNNTVRVSIVSDTPRTTTTDLLDISFDYIDQSVSSTEIDVMVEHYTDVNGDLVVTTGGTGVLEYLGGNVPTAVTHNTYQTTAISSLALWVVIIGLLVITGGCIYNGRSITTTLFVALIGLLLIGGTVGNTTYAAPQLNSGDVSCDGDVNVIDALFILYATIGQRNAGSCPVTATTFAAAECDVNSDTQCDIDDTMTILECVVGLPNTLCPAGTIIAPPPASNMLINGSFDAPLAPDWWNSPDGSLTINNEGEACLDVAAGTANPWDAMLGQNDLLIENGVEYDLSFTAYSVGSSETGLVIKVGDQNPDYAEYWGDTFNTSATPQLYSYTFTMGDATNAESNLNFHLGGGPARIVCFDDIALNQAGTAPAPTATSVSVPATATSAPTTVPPTSAPPSASNMIINGAFSAPLDPDWWHSPDGSLTINNGEACLDVAAGTSDPWDALFGQNDLLIENGGDYELSFTAYSVGSSETGLIVKVGDQNPPDYTEYWGDTFNTSTTPQAYNYTFTMGNTTNTESNASFQLGGGAARIICFDDVTLTQVGSNPVPTATSIPPTVPLTATPTLMPGQPTATPQPPTATPPPSTFVHPGAVNSEADLEFVKVKIAAGEEPWTSAFNQMRNMAVASSNNTAPTSENGQKSDGQRAYANALAWYYTDDVAYAENAINILNMWGTTFNGYSSTSGQDLLQGAWIGALLGPAAEIMRGYAGWDAADMAQTQNMFRDYFYPVLNTMSTWNGNVDLTQIDAMMSIAVFNEDQAEFDLGIERLENRLPAYFYLSSDPAGSLNYGGSNANNWYNPTQWVDGLTQETCRDNGHHAQYAMASALHAVEVAYNQGRTDIAIAHTERFVDTMELISTQTLTGSMQGVCADDTTTTSLHDTWQAGYNLYSTRLGNALPQTADLLNSQVIPNGWSDWNIFFETLTHLTE